MTEWSGRVHDLAAHPYNRSDGIEINTLTSYEVQTRTLYEISAFFYYIRRNVTFSAQ